jgi:hypothetical protein
MTKRMRRSIVAVFATMTLGIGLAGPASAQVVQDGLVNVNIGDVTILEDVNVAVAANILANVCANVDVDAAVGIIAEIDAGSLTEQVCRIGGGNPDRRGGQTITITQN